MNVYLHLSRDWGIAALSGALRCGHSDSLLQHRTYETQYKQYSQTDEELTKHLHWPLLLCTTAIIYSSIYKSLSAWREMDYYASKIGWRAGNSIWMALNVIYGFDQAWFRIISEWLIIYKLHKRCYIATQNTQISVQTKTSQKHLI